MDEVMRSPKFSTVQQYFMLGMWKESHVRSAVIKGWITSSEFTEITGITY